MAMIASVNTFTGHIIAASDLYSSSSFSEYSCSNSSGGQPSPVILKHDNSYNFDLIDRTTSPRQCLLDRGRDGSFSWRFALVPYEDRYTLRKFLEQIDNSLSGSQQTTTGAPADQRPEPEPAESTIHTDSIGSDDDIYFVSAPPGEFHDSLIDKFDVIMEEDWLPADMELDSPEYLK